MRGQWFIWALAAAVGIFVLVIFNYQGQQDSVSLTEIFPDQSGEEDKTENIEYEFVDAPQEPAEVEVPAVAEPPVKVAPKPVERRPEVAAHSVTPARSQPVSPPISQPPAAVARTTSPQTVPAKPVPARTVPAAQSASPARVTPSPAPAAQSAPTEVIPADSLNTAFTIQVASFKDLPSAEVALKGIKAAGHPAYIVSKDLGAKGTYFRIYVGKYDTKEEANQKLSELKPKYDSSFIISP
jgi:cell division septation protein DedD